MYAIFINMNETEITGDWIDRYNEGELNEADKAVFEERMKNSPVLRSEVLVDAALNRLLMDPEMMDLMQKIHAARSRDAGRHTPWKYWLVAASLAVLVMAGVVIFRMQLPGIRGDQAGQVTNTPGRNPGYVEQHPDGPGIPCIAAENRDMLSRRFVPLPELELLAGYATRSHPLEITSPLMDAAVPKGGRLTFTWTRPDMDETLTLEILNNRGVRVMELFPGYVTSFSLETKLLPDGLYYWKVMVDDDLVKMGRFMVLTLEKPGV
jgi:hypothetical protein